MLAMGLVITPTELSQAIRSPGILALNALCCFGMMPLLSLFLSNHILHLPVQQTVGLVLLGSVSGGQASLGALKIAVPASAGARHHHFERPGYVRDVVGIRGVRAQHHPRAGSVGDGEGEGEGAGEGEGEPGEGEGEGEGEGACGRGPD